MGSTGNFPLHKFDSNRMSHAYIMGGVLADTAAMAVVCSAKGAVPCLSCVHCDKASRGIHPDITIVDKPPDKREILVDQIRELKKDVIIVPNESDKKVYVINDADIMRKEAQNALLQILEEPPRHTVFILKSENRAALLPTVLSRCIELKIQVESDVFDADGTDAANAFLSAIEGGNVQLAKIMFQLEKLDKIAFSTFVAAARKGAAERLKADAEKGVSQNHAYTQVEESLRKAEEYLNLNVGIGHISGMLCAVMIKAM
jgi:hypothetical protein